MTGPVTKLVKALIEYAKETEKEITVLNTKDENVIFNFIVIDEESDTVYIGSKQDYLTLDGGTLELDNNQ